MNRDNVGLPFSKIHMGGLSSFVNIDLLLVKFFLWSSASFRFVNLLSFLWDLTHRFVP